MKQAARFVNFEQARYSPSLITTDDLTMDRMKAKVKRDAARFGLLRLYCLLLLFPVSVHAEIYKCEDNGSTRFSDSPCGDNAEDIKVDVPEQTGTALTSDAMGEMADELHQDRRKRELDRDIDRQYQKIEDLAEHYHTESARLKEKLAKHKSTHSYSKFRSHPYKQSDFEQTRAEIKNEISEVKGKYKTDKQLAYNKLNRLKQERRKFR